MNDIEGIADTDGIDLIAVGGNDLARALGELGQINPPKVRSTIEKIATTIKKVGKARMEFPLMLPTLPLGIPDLLALGVGYTSCNPAAHLRLLRAYEEQVKEIRAALIQ